MHAADEALRPEDRRTIVDVSVRYCWAIDGRDWADLANVFSADATLELGPGPAIRGLPAIQAFIARVLEPLDSSQHMVTNHQLDGAGGDVRSRCYFHAQHTRKGAPGGANYVVGGIYRDAWTATPAGWRIRSRVLEVLWTEGNAEVVGRATARP